MNWDALLVDAIILRLWSGYLSNLLLPLPMSYLYKGADAHSLYVPELGRVSKLFDCSGP